LHRALDVLAALGARITVVKIPLLSSMLDHLNLAHLILYEFRQHFIGVYGDSYRPEDFGPIVQSDLKKADEISRQEYDAALAAQARISEQVHGVFEEADVVLTPTQPMHPPTLAADTDAFADARRFLLPASFIGWPSVSVPCGLFSSGLPIGLQIVGDYFQETRVLRAARTVERALWGSAASSGLRLPGVW
jgi:aspartyl-tRNA(Asn)/glutamyl-tRNA(Gln) amidotransferase subunit A